ncbi:MAG: hypothetical protein B7X95_09600 [Methylophilaceae bacterium 17-44-8]|jgi:dihydrofolate reductase|nr:MAG: hypothetical protein B7Y48_08880 [Methylophilales bacterium 28-44-11]OZA04607.1 MAG: hypothetical protein B7X95_09600 [Methylophilaceae bacterium 17-44-8]
MARLIFSHMVSLDGYIETPPTYSGPNWATTDDELVAYFLDQEDSVSVHVYGRRVYEAVSSWWPHAAEDPSISNVLSAYGKAWVKKPKLVVSKSLSASTPNTTVVREDPAHAVRKLLETSTDNVMLYGGELAASLIREALVDEIHSYINPVCLGGGTPMFPTLEPVLRLRLIDLHSFASGVVLLRYSTRSDA